MVSLGPDNVRIAAHAMNKAEAIRRAGDILVEGGYIHPGYIHSMMKREQITATYLGNGIAIPHGLSPGPAVDPAYRSVRASNSAWGRMEPRRDRLSGHRHRRPLRSACRYTRQADRRAGRQGDGDAARPHPRCGRDRSSLRSVTAGGSRPGGGSGADACHNAWRGLSADIEVTGVTGLHARPASVFVSLAKEFRSDIRVYHDGKTANGKSMVSMLRLGVERGGIITITTDGPDAAKAIETLQNAVAEGLGEEEEKHPSRDPPRLNQPVSGSPGGTG